MPDNERPEESRGYDIDKELDECPNNYDESAHKRELERHRTEFKKLLKEELDVFKREVKLVLKAELAIFSKVLHVTIANCLGKQQKRRQWRPKGVDGVCRRRVEITCKGTLQLTFYCTGTPRPAYLQGKEWGAAPVSKAEQTRIWISRLL